MPDRAADMMSFLAANGLADARVVPLAQDASFRRYWRVSAGPARAVLMDAPPDKEPVAPYVRIARHLTSLGYSAPAIRAADIGRGFVLLEDLGDGTFTRLLARGSDEQALYTLATDLLIDLHCRPAAAAVPEALPEYDDGRLLAEALLLIDWYMPAVTGAAATQEARASYLETWRRILPAARAVPSSLVLRDYHVDNLMRLPDRPGVAACGLLDFQDALRGPVTYDLMSLLEDARRDVPDSLRAAMRARYLAAFPALDVAAFDASMAVLGAQRHCKVIGIFTRLCVRDGKPAYLEHMPRLWRLLDRAAEHPAAAPLRDWLDTHLPAVARRVPEPRPAA